MSDKVAASVVTIQRPDAAGVTTLSLGGVETALDARLTPTVSPAVCLKATLFLGPKMS